MENLKCLFTNFPWDILFFMLGLGLLLWWLLSQLLGREYRRRIEELEARISSLGDENIKLKDRNAYLEAELENCRKSKASSTAAVAAAGIAPKVASKPQKDDLKIVEGIGPKIEKLFNDAGIYSFAQLANSQPDKLKEILLGGGTRFQMHDPTTWPEQAAMARDGKWEELKKWQEKLDGGKSE